MKKIVLSSLFGALTTCVYAQVVPKPSQDPEIRRLASQQVYYERALNLVPQIPSAHIPIPDTSGFYQLCNFVTTNSIPFLVQLNKELIEKNKDETQKKSLESLKILLCIESPMAFDAIFTIFDMADEKYGENSPLKKQTGKTLRELLLADIFEPYEKEDNPPQWKTVVEDETWQNMFKNYQPEKLSAKNQAFLANTRQHIQVKEEKNNKEPQP